MQRQQHNFSSGDQAESQAGLLLQQKGWRILDRNICIQHGEVDLVAFDPTHREVVFVEVKYRRSSNAGHPAQAVNRRKILHLQRVAAQYCIRKQLNYDWRFDVIAITPNKIDHLENVSWSGF